MTWTAFAILAMFPSINVYFHMFQVLLRQIVVNLTENAIRKPPQTVPSLPYLQWNMFLFSKVEKVRQNEEKLKHHCAKFTFSPLIVFIFFVISHCSFFTTWNQDLLTHLKRHQLRNVVGSQKKYLFALSENHSWICPKSYSAFSSRYLKAQLTW